MGTKETAGHNEVIRRLEPIVQRTANDLSLSATNVVSAVLAQKYAVPKAHVPKYDT
jgi:hypothetical protein